uniref:Uncharacterized protein n=1 Tax=viral metagenome TaxID=1070528 RepID=A0A6C0K210_9ZZZZ
MGVHVSFRQKHVFFLVGIQKIKPFQNFIFFKNPNTFFLFFSSPGLPLLTYLKGANSLTRLPPPGTNE